MPCKQGEVVGWLAALLIAFCIMATVTATDVRRSEAVATVEKTVGISPSAQEKSYTKYMFPQTDQVETLVHLTKKV